MNFDQLKEQWNKEGSNVQIPDTIEQLRESKHPVSKIQKSMKKNSQCRSLLLFLSGSSRCSSNFQHRNTLFIMYPIQ